MRTPRLKIDHVQDNYEDYLAAPRICGRCLRTFLAGQRIRMAISGVVERVMDGHGYALLNVRHTQQWWEHENMDDCTEPR